MAVYVDPIWNCLKSRRWPWNECCHLVADDVKELHEFAKKIGLKYRWYQHKTMPHYDLTRNKRVLAVKSGAKEIDRKQMHEMIQKQRKKLCLKK